MSEYFGATKSKVDHSWPLLFLAHFLPMQLLHMTHWTVAHVKPPEVAASTRSIWHKPCTRVTLIPALKCQGKQRSETWRYMAKLYHHYHPN